ncbi:MAG: hypothetical protein AAGA58_15540, partial [Verrucomicrobiota bacterium]
STDRRHDGSGDKQKTFAFRLSLIPYAELSWARSAVYENKTLKVVRGDSVAFEQQLTARQSQRLEEMIETFDEEAWGGFHVFMDVLDGDVVRCRVNRGDEILEFRGSNGSPKGFAALLSEINSIVQQDVFPDDWKEREKYSKRFEDEKELMAQLKSSQNGEQGSAHAKPVDD